MTRTPQHTDQQSPDHAFWIYFTTIVGSGLVYLDVTTINFALPALENHLGLSRGESRWVVQSYSLVVASLILVGGSLADRLGRVNMFMTGTGMFAAASVAAALAPGLPVLIAGRVAQGVGGALIIPATLAIISDVWHGSGRGKAIGTWAGFTALGTAAGPIMGGFIVDQFSWRDVFWLNVPICIMVMIICWFLVPRSHDPDMIGRPDWPGGLVASVAFFALVVGFTRVTEVGWVSWNTIGAFAVFLGAVLLLIWVERQATDPMIKVWMFKSAAFSGGNSMALLLYAALDTMLYFLPFAFTEVRGYSDMMAGVAILPYVVIIVTGSRFTGGLVHHLGARIPMIAGPLIVAAGYVIAALRFGHGSYWMTTLPAIIVLGMGMTVTLAPMLTTIMSAIPREKGGLAAGVNNAAVRTGAVLGVAIFSVVMVNVFSDALYQDLSGTELDRELRTEIMGSADDLTDLKPPKALSDEQLAALGDDADTAFEMGVRQVMWWNAGLAIVASAIAFLAIPARTSEIFKRSGSAG